MSRESWVCLPARRVTCRLLEACIMSNHLATGRLPMGLRRLVRA